MKSYYAVIGEQWLYLCKNTTHCWVRWLVQRRLVVWATCFSRSVVGSHSFPLGDIKDIAVAINFIHLTGFTRLAGLAIVAARWSFIGQQGVRDARLGNGIVGEIAWGRGDANHHLGAVVEGWRSGMYRCLSSECWRSEYGRAGRYHAQNYRVGRSGSP